MRPGLTYLELDLSAAESNRRVLRIPINWTSCTGYEHWARFTNRAIQEGIQHATYGRGAYPMPPVNVFLLPQSGALHIPTHQQTVRTTCKASRMQRHSQGNNSPTGRQMQGQSQGNNSPTDIKDAAAQP
eukprot:1175619-Prorocentrum_minimum.AAC.1